MFFQIRPQVPTKLHQFKRVLVNFHLADGTLWLPRQYAVSALAADGVATGGRHNVVVPVNDLLVRLHAHTAGVAVEKLHFLIAHLRKPALEVRLPHSQIPPPLSRQHSFIFGTFPNFARPVGLQPATGVAVGQNVVESPQPVAHISQQNVGLVDQVSQAVLLQLGHEVGLHVGYYPDPLLVQLLGGQFEHLLRQVLLAVHVRPGCDWDVFFVAR